MSERSRKPRPNMRYPLVCLLYFLLINTGCNDKAVEPVAVSASKQTSVHNEDDKHDNLAPIVSIRPASQLYLAPQRIAISATADDNVGIYKVRFYDNGNYRGTDYSTPYTHNWSFSGTDNGPHLWEARAYDKSGNSNTDSVILDVEIVVPSDTQAPNVSISPTTSKTYRTNQTVAISASASDNQAIARVEFYHNDILYISDTNSPYTIEWSITPNNNGSHNWQAIAYDTSGNSASDIATLKVDIEPTADYEAPSIWITPAARRRYITARTVKISASTSNIKLITRVDFFLDGMLVVSDSTSPYTTNWIISANDNGSHIWQAIAYDTAGNSATDSVEILVDIDSRF